MHECSAQHGYDFNHLRAGCVPHYVNNNFIFKSNIIGNGEALILHLQIPLGKTVNENDFQGDTDIET